MEKYIKKFTDTPYTIDDLKTSKAYILREKINKGESLTRDEKNWITERVNSTPYSRIAIPVSGYLIDFSDILKRYHFSYLYDNRIWYEAYAVDKTSLRKYNKCKITILEYI